MPEVTIKYKGAKALKALQDLTKMFDMVIENPANNKRIANLPVTFSKNPDVKALAGIWQGKDITLEELRKEAWGDRV
jgi:hypothetical protein